MKITKFLIAVILSGTFNLGLYSQGVVISDISEASTVADESAVLDIQSTTKGMLIPRMTTTQRNSISNAKNGLLVFDLTEGNFYLFGQSKWTDLSTPANLWTVENSNVRLTNTTYSMDIGNNVTTNNFIIEADENAQPDDPIFQVKDNSGNLIFAVTSEGVQIYVKNESKGVSGGFAVGRYGSLKGMDTTYFSVNRDEGTRAYVTAQSGGFAVGQYGSLKGMGEVFFSVNENEGTFVNAGSITSKGVSGGFAVGQYGSLKGVDTTYFTVTKEEGTRAYATGVSGGFAVGHYTSMKGMDEIFFSIDRESGTNVYTDYATGVSGGFAVGKYGAAKGMETVIFDVNSENGTRAYATGNSGGFAVGRYASLKGMDEIFFNVNRESGTNVYTDYATGVSGGFAVGRYGSLKGMETVIFDVNSENGTRAYATAKSGGFAVGQYASLKGMGETYFSVDSAKTIVNYKGNDSNTGLFVNQIGFSSVGNLFNVRKDYVNFGYIDFYGVIQDINFSIGNQNGEITPLPNPDFYISNDKAYFSSQVSMGASDIMAHSYKLPLSRGSENEILKLDGIGNLTWQNDNTGGAIPKNSSFVEELDALKKENTQLRKDIEEIKELLKNNSK